MGKRVTDHIGRKVEFKSPPDRILSVVPSLTELLFALGLGHKVVGRTSFCTHPKDKVETIPRVGGTKKLRLDAIRDLEPDLVIANKEENLREQVLELHKTHPVWVSDVRDLDDALKVISDIGELTGTQARAGSLTTDLQAGLDNLPRLSRQLSVVYLIWKKPLMGVGGDTFINDVLSRLGFDNLLQKNDRYPSLSPEQARALHPNLVFLSSEPFPFAEKHLEYVRKYFPNAQTEFVDGRLFSWYGSALLEAIPYFRRLLNQLEAG